MIDDDTQLGSVATSDTELKFNCTLVTVSKSELNLQALIAEQRKQLQQEAERASNLRQMLQYGGALTEIRIRKEPR